MTEYRVTLSNRDGAIHIVNGRRPLLEQLRDQGVDLPYGCEYGGCITCAAKLVKGDIDQRRLITNVSVFGPKRRHDSIDQIAHIQAVVDRSDNHADPVTFIGWEVIRILD